MYYVKQTFTQMFVFRLERHVVFYTLTDILTLSLVYKRVCRKMENHNVGMYYHVNLKRYS
jgi:hypothetical protein